MTKTCNNVAAGAIRNVILNVWCDKMKNEFHNFKILF